MTKQAAEALGLADLSEAEQELVAGLVVTQPISVSLAALRLLGICPVSKTVEVSCGNPG
jgi:hypothetical protein